MATIVKPNTFSAGATIVAAEHNSNFDTVYDEVNGSLSNANISNTAAIAISKISIASSDPVYFGGATTEGSWKIQRSGNDLNFYRYESAVWTKKGGITA